MALLARLVLSSLRSARTASADGNSIIMMLSKSSLQLPQLCADWTTNSLTQTGAPQQFSAASRSQLHNWSQAAMPQQQMQRLGLQPGSSSSSSSSSSGTSSAGRGISSSAAQGSQCDCPTLGGPTPDIVTVEYDEDDVDRFIALADAIEEAYPNVVVEGNASGPGRPGSFEVTGTNGAVLFSKLSSGGWPQAEVVVDALGAAAACGVPQQ